MKKIFVFISLSVLLIQCNSETPRYTIAQGKVGLVSKDMTTQQIDSVYASDSVVYQNTKGQFLNNTNIEIFEAGGEKLLSLSRSKDENRKDKISHVQIFDSRFKTDNGASLDSDFKAFRDHYKIKSIQKMINTVIVFFQDQDFYVTIDMEELPDELKIKKNIIIESIHIPDTAKIKYLMLGWE